VKWVLRAFVLGFVLEAACIGTLHAQTDSPAPAAAADAAPVTDPALVAQHYREILARPEFQETPDSSINTRFEDWLSQWFKRLGDKIGSFTYASGMPAFESMLMTVLIVLSLAVLIYIAVRLTRRRARMEAEPNTESADPKAFRAPETYDAEIAGAIRAGDWHMAWLASWRQFLSRLENRNLVEADRTRTNREYLAQLRQKPLPATALGLVIGMVDAYDRTIYGRASIGQDDWNLFHRHINEAALLLHLDEKRAPTKPEMA
jgi:hypothetical protein